MNFQHISLVLDNSGVNDRYNVVEHNMYIRLTWLCKFSYYTFSYEFSTYLTILLDKWFFPEEFFFSEL